MQQEIIKQQVLLVVIDDSHKDMAYSIEELSQLVDTAGGIVQGVITQKRDAHSNATMVGKGKIQEIRQYVEDNDIELVVFDDNLSTIQRRNIKEILDGDNMDVKILDKTDLILDIFALHANTAEGKQQVELAQLQYSLATKDSTNYSRQGGGIGTRGPGETQLETNKRAIRKKILMLRQQLEQLEQQRAVQQKSRKVNNIFTVALVGYTNAGKSTLFNSLAGADVLAQDKLFATLDTTTRRLELDKGIEVVIVDTVGFIRELPHSLIEAFKSTLAEAATADLVLQICDLSDKHVDEHIAVCQDILTQLKTTGNIIKVFNKADLLDSQTIKMYDGEQIILASGKTGYGIDDIKKCILAEITNRYITVNFSCPYSEQNDVFAQLKKYATNHSIQYTDTGLEVTATIYANYMYIFEKYNIL